jgi:serine/threonine protein kinase
MSQISIPASVIEKQAHNGSSPAPAEEESIALSSNLDDYDILDPVGYGASAVVYAALYKPLNRRVAVKIIDLDAFERHQIEELRVYCLVGVMTW